VFHCRRGRQAPDLKKGKPVWKGEKTDAGATKSSKGSSDRKSEVQVGYLKTKEKKWINVRATMQKNRGGNF